MTYRNANQCGTLTREAILEMRSRHVSAADIAAVAGVCVQTVYRALQEWGATTARGGDRRSRAWRDRCEADITGAAEKAGRP